MSNQLDDVFNNKFCYENTDVLINKLDVKDPIKLKNIEIEKTAYKLSLLNLGDYPSINQTWDVKHYLSIHKFLFDELYSFAGNYREEDISKSCEPYSNDYTFFCPKENIGKELQRTLRNMEDIHIMVNSREKLVLFLSKFFLDLNIIHPFREGNGRTMREFLREYVERINKRKGLNYELNYDMDEETKEQYLKSSILLDKTLAYNVFDKLVKEKEIINEKNITL